MKVLKVGESSQVPLNRVYLSFFPGHAQFNKFPQILNPQEAGVKEVVVTGYGLVSALGNDPDTVWQRLLAGESGISKIDRFDLTDCTSQIGGQVRDFDPTAYIDPRDLRRMPRYIQYAVYSALKAAEMAGLSDSTALDKSRAGVVIGSGMGGMEIFHDTSSTLVARGPRRVSPFFVPTVIANMIPGEVSMRLGWSGPNWSAVSACATSNHNIISAIDQIRSGRADVMLAGGSEEGVCQIALAGFCTMKALSTRNDEPHRASRPFDRDRDGFVIAEGGAVLCLESREHAEARGAKILGRILGVGVSGDAYHMSQPREDGAGVMAAMEMALADAGLTIDDISYINTHGTSTPLGDVAECTAIQRLFGEKSKQLKINSTKSMTGHALGAAAGIEAIVVLKSLQDQKLHPTINVEHQDEKITLDVCANRAVDWKMDYAFSNSFGFGGHNSTLLLGR